MLTVDCPWKNFKPVRTYPLTTHTFRTSVYITSEEHSFFILTQIHQGKEVSPLPSEIRYCIPNPCSNF